MKLCSSKLLFPLVLTLLAVPAAAWNDCDHEAPRQATIDAAGVSSIVIEAAAGSLHVRGRQGLARVEAKGTACADRESKLNDIQLRGERRGDSVYLIVDIPDGDSAGWLDLEVDLPAEIAVAIEDSSGSLELRGVASAEIEDGSGSIVVDGVGGDLKIRDGSGSIDITDVEGVVWVRDGSGSIDIERAAAVVIDEDGSGSIDVADIDGDVRVDSDGSGSIRVDNVGGDFVVDRDGSGGIDYRDVDGRVSVP